MSGPGRGGNLTQPLKKFLINVPSADNLGVYEDQNTGERMLVLKQEGHAIPANGNEEYVVSQPQDPVAKVVTVLLSNVAPLDPLNYNYGVHLTRRVQHPGVNNSNFFPHIKYYGSVLPAVDTPVISNAQLNAMRDEIISQVNADRGYTRRPEHEMPGSPAIASRPIRLENWDAASAMTLDGVVVAANANIEGFVGNINATERFAAVQTSATEMTVVRKTIEDAADFPVFAGTAGTISAIAENNGEFAFHQRFDTATFEVTVEPTVGAQTILQNTIYPTLTYEDVYRIFSHIPNDGYLSQMRPGGDQVLPNTRYVKINIDVGQMHYDLHGASHGVMFMNACEIYMPEDEWNNATDRWAAVAVGPPRRMMDAGNDDDVTDLFDEWSP